MAEEGKEVQVIFGANIKALLSGMKEAAEAVKGQTEVMKGSVEKLHHGFEGLLKGIGAIGAILAGGAMFKKAIDATVHWNVDVMKLAKTLGITTQEASYLNVALHSIGVSSDTYQNAVKMMIRQINTGGEGFKKLGVEVKDANGHLRPAQQIMEDTVRKLQGMKAGIDQNAAAASVFSRAWGPEMRMILRLTAESMEHAKHEAEQLGLVVGPEAAAQTLQYKDQMRLLHLVTESLEIQVGRQLLPILTQLGSYFGKVGPGLAQGFGYALKGLTQAFMFLKAVIETIVSAMSGMFFGAIAAVGGLARVMYAVARGEFKEAGNIAKATLQEVRNEAEASFEGVSNAWKNFAKDSKKLWEHGPEAKGPVQMEGDTFDPDKGKKKDSRLKEWEAVLKADQEKLSEQAFLHGKFFERDLAQELAFWQDKKALGNLSKEETAAVDRKIAETQMQQHREALEARKAMLSTEAAEIRADLDRKLEFARAELGMYQEGTKGYEEARKKVLAVEREIRDQLQTLRLMEAEAARDSSLRGLETAEEGMKQQVALGLATYQEQLEAQRRFLAQKFEAEQNYLQAELAQAELTAEQKAQLNGKLLALDEKYQLERKKLRNEAQIKDMEDADKMFAPVTDAWNRSMAGMLAGTMRFSEGVRNLWQAFGKVLDQVIMDMVNKWIAGELRKLAVTAAAKIKEMVLHQSTAAATVATTTATAGAQITAAGAVAGANAAASAAQTPFIGWSIAIPAGLAVLAAVMALKGRIGSAAGGWDLPSGLNPVAQLHANEMVLPAHLADRIRNITEPGGGGQQAPAFAPTFHITALDARGVEQVLRDNNSAVGKAVREYARNLGGKR